MRLKRLGILTAAALLGCHSRSASPPPTPPPAADAEPTWLAAGSGFFGAPRPVARGVGVANNIRTRPLATHTAVSNARAELMKHFLPLLSALFKRYDMPTDEEAAADERVQRQFSEVITSLVQNAKPAATWEARETPKVAALLEVPFDQVLLALKQAAPANDRIYAAHLNHLEQRVQGLAEER